MTHVLNTSSVEPRHRLAYWTEMVCETYVQLECDPVAGERSIEGEIASDRLATLELSCVTSTAQRVQRTPARIARSSEDFLLVSIQAQGEGKVMQHGRTAHLEPGDFALYDSTCPYELHFDGPFRQYVLMIPGPVLRTTLHDTHRLTATTVSGRRGAGHLMIEMISTLAADLPTLVPESARSATGSGRSGSTPRGATSSRRRMRNAASARSHSPGDSATPRTSVAPSAHASAAVRGSCAPRRQG